MAYENSRKRQQANTTYNHALMFERKAITALVASPKKYAKQMARAMALAEQSHQQYSAAIRSTDNPEESHALYLTDVTACLIISLNLISSKPLSDGETISVPESYVRLLEQIESNQSSTLLLMDQCSENTKKLIIDNENKAVYCKINMAKTYLAACDDSEEALVQVFTFIEALEAVPKSSNLQIASDVSYTLAVLNESYADICSTIADQEGVLIDDKNDYLDDAMFAYSQASSLYLNQSSGSFEIAPIHLSYLQALETKILLNPDNAVFHAKEMQAYVEDNDLNQVFDDSCNQDHLMEYFDHLILAGKTLDDKPLCQDFCGKVITLYTKTPGDQRGDYFERCYQRAISVNEERTLSQESVDSMQSENRLTLALGTMVTTSNLPSSFPEDDTLCSNSDFVASYLRKLYENAEEREKEASLPLKKRRLMHEDSAYAQLGFFSTNSGLKPFEFNAKASFSLGTK